MARGTPPIRVESRWLAGTAVVAVVALVSFLPGRISFYPAWVPFGLGAVMVVPMIGAVVAPAKGSWEKVERISAVLFFVVVVGGAIALLIDLVQAMVTQASGVTGIELLASSVGLWVTNVLAFSLVYWQIDRGGPHDREQLENVPPDWQFTQRTGLNDNPLEWQPTFIDYLYLAYSTATAFSTTDATPLSARAKLLMMLESTISLVTILIVASRAINVLG